MFSVKEFIKISEIMGRIHNNEAYRNNMKQNTPIEIQKLANGFYVCLTPNQPITTDNFFVFRTMAELCEFLHEHFTHRAAVDKIDIKLLKGEKKS